MLTLPTKTPSVVGSIEVKVGDKVVEGQELFTVETSKGKRPIKSKTDGMVKEIFVAIGDEVAADVDMMLIEEAGSAEDANKVDELVEKAVEKKSAEVLVIGGGPGGYVAAIYAAMHGKKVVLVEKARLGGTCLNVGCIPTKTLIESANLYAQTKELEDFGIRAENVSFDFSKVVKRKDGIVKNLTDGIGFLMNKHNIEVLDGLASFESDNKVLVDADKKYEIDFNNAVIATGSKQAYLGIEGEKLPSVMTSTEALSLEALPKSITIIGGGVIGMEFAFIFNDFGVEVNVVEYADNILLSLDTKVSDLLKKIAEKKGIKISVSAKVESISECENNMSVVTYLQGGKRKQLASEKVLYAVGRAPNIEGLGLENTGVRAAKYAVLVDDKMKTSVDNIYAIGDVTAKMQLAHVASHQGIVAVDNILGHEHEMTYDAVPSVIFTHPEIAVVGVAKADVEKHIVSTFDFVANGKAMVMNETEGFITLIKDRETGHIVGGCIIGADASTTINVVTLAIKEKMSEKELMATIFPHPTTGEVVHEVAMGLGIGTLHQ